MAVCLPKRYILSEPLLLCLKGLSKIGFDWQKNTLDVYTNHLPVIRVSCYCPNSIVSSGGKASLIASEEAELLIVVERYLWSRVNELA